MPLTFLPRTLSRYLKPPYIQDVTEALAVSFVQCHQLYISSFDVQSRIGNLEDLRKPELSAYFFEDPDLHSDAARKLKGTVNDTTYSESLCTQLALSYLTHTILVR